MKILLQLFKIYLRIIFILVPKLHSSSQANFFAALCNIFAIFRQFCDIIAALLFVAAYYRQLCNIICQLNYRRKNGRSRQ